MWKKNCKYHCDYERNAKCDCKCANANVNMSKIVICRFNCMHVCFAQIFWLSILICKKGMRSDRRSKGRVLSVKMRFIWEYRKCIFILYWFTLSAFISDQLFITALFFIWAMIVNVLCAFEWNARRNRADKNDFVCKRSCIRQVKKKHRKKTRLKHWFRFKQSAGEGKKTKEDNQSVKQ